MQYFLIEAETQDPLPEIINWYGKINPQYINEKDADKIKNWELLNVKVCQDTVFPDVLSDPFFMLSKNAAEIVSHYEPGISMIGIQLFSRKNRILLPYFLPILPMVNCLSSQSEFVNEDIDISKGVLVEKAISSQALFQLAGIDTQRVVIRLDLLESLLRREALSIRIQELEVV